MKRVLIMIGVMALAAGFAGVLWPDSVPWSGIAIGAVGAFFIIQAS